MPERSPRGSWILGLTGLWAFAVAQPLLDLVGNGPEFLLAHRLTGGQILVGAILLTLGPPALVGGLLWLLGRWLPRAAAAIALLCAAGLLFTQALQIGNALGLGPSISVAVAALGALGLTLVIYRGKGLPGLSTAVGLCALLFLTKFTFFTPVRGLIFTEPSEQQALPRVSDPRDIVLLVFDELPTGSLLAADGRIDDSRFPAFARLVGEGVFFPAATAPHHSTSYAVPAILTGRIPDRPRLPTHLDHPENLFTWLAPTHDVRAVETMTSLCPVEVCEPTEQEPWRARLASLGSDLRILYLHVLLPEAWRADLPPVTGTWRDFRRTVRAPGQHDVAGEEWSARYDVASRVDRFIAGLASASSPSVHYLHLELPHIPWRYLPDGSEYGPISGPNFAHGAAPGDGRWIGTEWEITQALQRHLLQLGYADRLLGRVLGALDGDPRLAQALLVVTADHGFSFFAGEPGRQPKESNLGEVLSVPLFVRGLGRAGSTDERPSRTTDLIATLAAAQDSPSPWPTDGVDLFGERPYDRPAAFVGPRGWRVRNLDPDRVRAAIRLARFRVAESFNEPGLDGLFHIGARRDLIGRPTFELPVRASERQVALEQPWFLSQVAPESGFVPVQLQGRVLGPEPTADTELVVAVNGVIQAATSPYAHRNRWYVSAMVPPDSLRAGRNRMELFEVRDTADGLELVSWGGTSDASYTVERDRDGEVLRLVTAGGDGPTLVEGAVRGRLFHQGLTFWGWALDARLERGTVILAFSNDRLIFATPTSHRPGPGTEAPETHGEAPIGFRFALPRALVADPDQIEVYAVAGDRASRLGG